MKAFHLVRGAEARSTKGFTLVELLVVMVVVGILATIALSAFLDHRRKSWDASVESDLRNAATFQHSVLAQGGAGHFGTSLDQLEAAGFRASADGNYFGGLLDFTVNATGGQSYCMTARSASGRHFAYSNDVGLRSRDEVFDPVSCM